MSNDQLLELKPFVLGIVKSVRGSLGLTGDAQDAIACAYQGLLEAHRDFDSARGACFKTFAYYRVRGAVLDDVRRSGYLPRRAHARMKAAESGSSGRIADEALGFAALGERPDIAPAFDPETRLMHERALAVADKLPDVQRRLVIGHYVDGRDFAEVAAELGLSKSWASRLHRQALGSLRKMIDSRSHRKAAAATATVSKPDLATVRPKAASQRKRPRGLAALIARGEIGRVREISRHASASRKNPYQFTIADSFKGAAVRWAGHVPRSKQPDRRKLKREDGRRCKHATRADYRASRCMQQKKRVALRRHQGLCATCGKVPSSAYQCSPCSKTRNARRRIRRRLPIGRTA